MIYFFNVFTQKNKYYSWHRIPIPITIYAKTGRRQFLIEPFLTKPPLLYYVYQILHFEYPLFYCNECKLQAASIQLPTANCNCLLITDHDHYLKLPFSIKTHLPPLDNQPNIANLVQTCRKMNQWLRVPLLTISIPMYRLGKRWELHQQDFTYGEAGIYAPLPGISNKSILHPLKTYGTSMRSTLQPVIKTITTCLISAEFSTGAAARVTCN
jgi:hypothetical protein